MLTRLKKGRAHRRADTTQWVRLFCLWLANSLSLEAAFYQRRCMRLQDGIYGLPEPWRQAHGLVALAAFEVGNTLDCLAIVKGQFHAGREAVDASNLGADVIQVCDEPRQDIGLATFRIC